MKTKALILILAASLIAPPSYAQRGLPKNDGLVNLDFHDVDIQDVAKSISEITGKNFMLDDRVRGKITIISPAPMSVQDAYQAFISALKMKNLCAVEVGSITQILPSRECKENPIATEGDEETVTGDQPITKMISLKFISANEIKQALNPLVSKNGTLVAYGPTNTLMITDTASNIQRLMKIIGKLDKQNFQASVEMIPLKFAQAQDIADKLNMIFDQEKGRGRGTRRGNDVEGGANVSKIIPDIRTNSLIVMATREGLERTLDLLSELDRPVEFKLEQNRVHVKKLAHADATELAQIMNSLITGQSTTKKKAADKKGASPAAVSGAQPAPGTEPLPWEDELATQPQLPASAEGAAIVRGAGGMFQDEVRIVADPSTNSVIITATPVDYSTLEPIINQLDQRRSQVFVEALIMEVNISKALSVGANGHGGGQKGNFNLIGASHVGSLTPAMVSQNAGLLADPKNPVGLILGGSSKGNIKIGGIEIPMQGALFHALQTNNVINVLSAPNILTTDNKKAEIVVGSKVPFKTGNAVVANGVSNTTFQREDIGIKLFVTPKIADENEVTLEVEQHIQEVEEVKGAGDIANSERSAKTTVIAQSGQTIVIGGLIKDRESKVVSKVPLLGDIPIIGHLFRDQSVTKEKNNLVLFLTPHILRDPMDLTRVSVKKNNERRRFNKAQGIGENKALYDYDLDKGLNMAPPVEKKATIEKKKRRFDYDRPDVDQEQQSSDTEEFASRRRLPRRESPKVDFAEEDSGQDPSAAISRRRGKNAQPVPNSTSGNPFADVRPPSSAQ